MSMHINIDHDTSINKCFRKVVYKDKNMEIILQSIKKGEYVDFEVHRSTQFIKCESGCGVVTTPTNEYELSNGDCIVVPEGIKHQIKNEHSQKFKFYTIYSKPVNDKTEC